MNSQNGADADGTAAFEAITAALNYPMFVVTTSDGDKLAGCLVGFTSQVSIDPPRFLVGLSNRNHTYRVAARATRLAVHVLPRDKLEIARLFGEETGDTADKFSRCSWHPGPHGLPILSDAAGWFSGDVLERLPLGDHVAFLLAPDSGAAGERLERLLTFADVRDFTPGHDA